jgi:hypothetical protein
MPNSFQVVGVDYEQFLLLLSLTDEQLRELAAKRCYTTASPGYPCRVSLEDASVWEELVFLPFQHQLADSPYSPAGSRALRARRRSNERARSLPRPLGPQTRLPHSTRLMLSTGPMVGNDLQPQHQEIT